MASSSVSQESLDTEDFEIAARKSRIRNLRARGALPRSTEREREEDNWNGQDENDGDTATGWTTGAIPEHESPSRSTPASRAKDKRSRPNHLHKGKLPKDKRKLREKRRSTGVGLGAGLAHLPSTESTGDSLDEDDDIEKASIETKRNTSYNEVIDADNPQTPSDDRIPKGFASRRNKSPSDLEADLEDNQDYDSTVSQSETNLTLIGKSDSTESNHQTSPKLSRVGRGSCLTSARYSPQETKSFKPYSPTTSDHDSKTPSSTSSSSSVLSRFRYGERSGDTRWRETENTNHETKEQFRPVSSILARYQKNESDNNSSGYTGYRYRDRYRDSSNVGITNNRSANTMSTQRDEEKIKLEQQLEKEKEENKKLKEMLDEKDKKIAELEREVTLLNKDLEDFDHENQKLVLENNALIRAVSQLSTTV